ncbi:lipocalin-like isoform X2 [Archocentrus centrarchus]|uniref:lipocalin-like isoform X2 n=1 Tax=Archocentrus centrarchus TaxID=63155 RepID=UPI0011EA0A9B|nr:lipocalin-like isoform X2 [Archocentrus centrarchus]
MASFLTLLGAVLCSLMVSSQVVPQADFDLQAIAGKWYHIGLATNAERYVSRRGKMNMGTYVITPLPNGDLDLLYSSVYNGTCRKMDKVANKTDVPGKYRSISRRTGHLSVLSIVDVKYDEYALTHAVNTKENDTYIVNKLYGRDADLSAEVQEKFRQFSLQTGVLPENVMFFPKSEECTSA